MANSIDNNSCSKENLNIISFNCNSFKSSITEIRHLTQKYDIICLQETWLCKTELHLLNNVSKNFFGTGISSVNPHLGIIIGRKYGGLAFLYRNDISNVKIINFDENWIYGMEITSNNKIIVILNIYMPYECSDNTDTF